MCMCEWASHKCGCQWRPKVLDFLELQLQVLVSHLKWVLGTKLHPSARTHALVTAESSLQFSDPNSFSSPSHYEQKAPNIARTTENCTNCSRRHGFLRGYDPTVCRELQTEHTGMVSNYVQIWDIRGREVWVYYLGSLGRDCKAENTRRWSQVTPPLFW